MCTYSTLHRTQMALQIPQPQQQRTERVRVLTPLAPCHSTTICASEVLNALLPQCLATACPRQPSALSILLLLSTALMGHHCRARFLHSFSFALSSLSIRAALA